MNWKRVNTPARQRLVLEPLEPRLLLSVTILSEDFEGGNLAASGWTVGDSNPAGTPAYWNSKASTFGGEAPHGGNWKGYCAGTGYGGDDNNPTYQNDMTAYMSRAIDLTGYQSATLSFWHLMPSLESPADGGWIYIDATNISGASGTVATWQQRTISLDSFVGGIHTLKFQFTSNSSVVAEGWYLDDILVTGETEDPDDTIAEAIPLGAVADTPLSAVGRTIVTGTDVDMYSFTVAAGQRVGFDLDNPYGGLDSYIRLFNAAGSELEANDDAWGPAPEHSAFDSFLEYTFNTAGTYYVGVSGIPNTAYNPLTGAGDAAGSTGQYDLTVRNLGRYVGRIAWAGGARVDIYDCDLTNDIALDDVAVVFGAPNTISSITLVGAQHKTGLGIVVSEADSVGKVSDKRSLPGDMAFFACEVTVASLALRGNITGFNLNGLKIGGIIFGADTDNDGEPDDLTAIYVGGHLPTLSLTGNLGGDTLIGGNLSAAKIAGSIVGDLQLAGNLTKLSVTGNWTGATSAMLIGSPKIGGALSGSIQANDVDAKGLSIGKLSAGQIGSLVVNVPGGVSSIAAASWAAGSLRAAWLGSLSAKGTKVTPGDFGADLTLLGAAGITTLGKVSISGTLKDAAWTISGVVSSLTVGRWGAGSTLAVGVDPGGDGVYFTGDDRALLPLGTISKGSIAAYDTAHGHDFGILAGLFGSGKVGGISPVLPFADGQFRIVQVL